MLWEITNLTIAQVKPPVNTVVNTNTPRSATMISKRRKKVYTKKRNNEGIFPVITVRVGRVLYRALKDSGAGSSYIPAKLIHLLKAEPVEVETKQTDMLMCKK